MKRAGMFLLLSIHMSLPAQERRPTPAPREELPQSAQQQNAELPSIRLPEFVITGRESIDLPSAEKRAAGSPLEEVPGNRPSNPPQERPEAGPRDDASSPASVQLRKENIGALTLGIGSFSTLKAGAFGSGFVEDAYLSGDARYDRTSGFAPWTDGSSFSTNASVKWPASFAEPLLRNSAATVAGQFASRSFHWYGGADPSASRSTRLIGFRTSLSGSFGDGIPAHAEISYRSSSVEDTTNSVSQSEFTLYGSGEGALFGYAARYWGGVLTSGSGGGAGGTIGDIRLGGEAHAWFGSDISTTFSLELASVTGQAGQHRTLFLPGVRLSFGFAEKHRFIGRFSPGTAYRNLFESVGEAPFIDASAPIRHTVYASRGGLGLESDWTSEIRSAFELESSRATDYPMLSDSGKDGTLRVFFGDVTETLIRASAVAKLFSNHYFSAIAIFRSSINSTTGSSVPNIPSFELRIGHVVQLSEKLSLKSDIQAISSREATIIGGSESVAGYTRVDVVGRFALFPALEISAGFQNLLDSNIEYWKGYRETPFSIVIGASYSL